MSQQKQEQPQQQQQPQIESPNTNAERQQQSNPDAEMPQGFDAALKWGISRKDNRKEGMYKNRKQRRKKQKTNA